MLPAHKNARFDAFFTRHIEARLRHRFAGACLQGLDDARRICQTRPVLFIVNHSAFWDALIVVWLSSRWLHCEAYAWMDGDNLRRLPFFRLLGAFGVRTGAPVDAARAMVYASRILNGAGRAVWLFPQGRQRHPQLRPLGFFPGSTFLARRAQQACVLPVSLTYVASEEEKPWVHVCFGPPLSASEEHEAAVVDLLDKEPAAWEAARQNPSSRAVRWLHFDSTSAQDSLAARLLAWICGRWLGHVAPDRQRS